MPSQPIKIAVLGAGSWGTVLADLLVHNGHQVMLWGNSQEVAAEINTSHTNRHYLPEFAIDPAVEASLDLEATLADAAGILFVIPTAAMRIVAKQVAAVLAKTGAKPILISATKGLEQNSHKRISQILGDEFPAELAQSLVIFSGPSHAEDVATRDITSLTVASENIKDAEWVQGVFMNEYFRLYTNDDMVGVELGGALKNVIAIGAGVLHGLGYGDNTKAALITRGIAEISRLGIELGANPLTFMGLSGIGDLIVTCTSVHSRNWRCGNALGQGQKLATVLTNMGMVVEGVGTAKAAHELSAQCGVEMPISESIYRVLYEDADVHQEIDRLMQRKGKRELDFQRY
ncbi:NAD(P)H-dependent glycerol-3-phosphate dehydrogenase [Lapidilactobacillus luobeiensis]|uniref:NAD(P)H-dependent glycerol-3-phosphate dehydrogenase n=1 Tax=Lapidilactobacillus luobeiensis TaxID=2950371 RepID=UPI0021C37FBB|nr:NAD(P)H-dependent glycerol-3-phosphate dehydrogenase [Lapidilactobacillus luobeiensis]